MPPKLLCCVVPRTMTVALAELFTEPVPQLLLVGAELLAGGSVPRMQPRAFTLRLTPSKELAGRGEPRRQEQTVLLPPGLPAASQGSGSSALRGKMLRQRFLPAVPGASLQHCQLC